MATPAPIEVQVVTTVVLIGIAHLVFRRRPFRFALLQPGFEICRPQRRKSKQQICQVTLGVHTDRGNSVDRRFLQ